MARTAVVAGVGPGLGESLARKFSGEGCELGLFARSEDFISDLAADLPAEAVAVPTDLREPDQVREGFDRVREAFGPVDVLVNHASAASWSGLMDSDLEAFERAWAVNCRGAFVATQEAVGDMLGEAPGDAEHGAGSGDGGTVVFTGATSAVRSLGGAIGFTAAKFAARGMAMDVAQEFGGEGVHVAHVVIDGQIDEPGAREMAPDRGDDTFLDPDEIAETYWHLVEQDDVSTRPFEVHVTNGPQNTEFI
jgi:NAD(P)-dependent dehydrogenase (short-subunit alcohol dehydrogenase family)